MRRKKGRRGDEQVLWRRQRERRRKGVESVIIRPGGGQSGGVKSKIVFLGPCMLLDVKEVALSRIPSSCEGFSVWRVLLWEG